MDGKERVTELLFMDYALEVFPNKTIQLKVVKMCNKRKQM